MKEISVLQQEMSDLRKEVALLKTPHTLIPRKKFFTEDEKSVFLKRTIKEMLKGVSKKHSKVKTDYEKLISNNKSTFVDLFRAYKQLQLMAATTKPNITQIWAELGNITPATPLEQQQGWNPTLPVSTYFNSRMQIYDRYCKYFEEQGISFWDSTVEYNPGGWVKGSDGILYNSLTSTNVGNDPVTDGGVNWEPLPFGTENISPTIITTSTVLTLSQMNKTIEVDATSGNITITLPPEASLSINTYVKIRVVGTGVNQNNRVIIKGNAAELIQNYNAHDIYFVGSWMKVVKTNGNKLVIDDYYDMKSLIWQAYLDAGTLSAGLLIFPAIGPNATSSVGNEGGFYSTITGRGTLKIRGDWELSFSIARVGTPTGSVTLELQHLGVNDQQQATHEAYGQASTIKPALNVPYKTGISESDVAPTVYFQPYCNQNISSGGFPGFTGKLIRRVI